MSRYKEDEFEDTACYHCYRMSHGIAYRDGDSKYAPLNYLCKECGEDPMSLMEVRNLEKIELEALEDAVQRGAEYLHVERGGITDLTELSELDALMFAKHIILGFGDGVRARAKTGKY